VPAARLLSVASQAGMRRPSAIDGGRFHSPLRGSSGMGRRLRRQPSPDSRLNPSLHPNEEMDTFGERTIGRMRRAVKRAMAAAPRSPAKRLAAAAHSTVDSGAARIGQPTSSCSSSRARVSPHERLQPPQLADGRDGAPR